MGAWTSTKPTRVLSALVRIGWTIARQRGSHVRLERAGSAPYSFAYHEGKELGPALLARIGKKTGLRPEDL